MAPESSTLKKGTRVVLIADLPGVGAGTAGRIGRAIGIKATRYRVSFDNGVESLSVAEGKLVSPAAWAYIQNNPVDPGNGQKSSGLEAAIPTGAAPSIAAAVTTGPATQSVMDASAQTPVQKAAPVEPQAAATGTSAAADDRLAALTAKSRDARKAAGVDIDAETVTNETSGDVTSDEPPENADQLDTNSAAEAAEEITPALVELPDGYYPPDNRIADLLASVRSE
jgi:hypothetical protein